MAKAAEKPDVEIPDAEAVFLAETLLPDAAAAFPTPRKPVGYSLADADVVLDTNVLLLPYRAGPNSLQQIVAALTPLKNEGRLFIPGRVAREFTRLRPQKLGELLQAISDQASRVAAPDQHSYPLLRELDEYVALEKAVFALQTARKTFIDAVGALRTKILSWEGNDPVSVAYAELFSSSCVRDLKFDEPEILEELRRQMQHKIPPGYKDSGKTDGGVGDLLIWRTILDIARDRKKPLVFVTGEEKADWMHRSGGRGFLPRFELVDEYRRAADGAAFYIIQMSQLLELLQVESSTVEEIKKEEVRSRDLRHESVDCPYCEEIADVELGIRVGSSALPTCAACGERFHVHRGSDGVFTRQRGGPSRIEGTDVVEVECPYCDADVEVVIGRNPKDSAAPTCGSCSERFHAHRARDLSVFTRRRGNRTNSATDENHVPVAVASEAEG